MATDHKTWSYNDEKRLGKLRRRILRLMDCMAARRDPDIYTDLPEINSGESMALKTMLDLYKTMAKEAADSTGHRVTVVNLSEVSTDDLRKMAKPTDDEYNDPDENIED